MKKGSKQKIILALLAVVLLASIAGYKLFFSKSDSSSPLPTPEVQQEGEPVSLEVFSPGVFIMRPGENDWQEVSQPGSQIYVGTKIKTDDSGRAQLTFENGTVTRLDSNTQITLEVYEVAPFETQISLDNGRVWSRIAKLLGKESYQTQSENLVAAVRGTAYGHEIIDGADKIIVAANQIEARCNNQTQEAIILQNYQGTFTCQEGVKPQISLLTRREREDEWFIFNWQRDQEMLAPSPTVVVVAPPPPTPKTTVTATPTPTPTPTRTSVPVGNQNQ